MEQAKEPAVSPAPDAVEVRHLRAFVAVAGELNFSRAAERLYLSQPALSRQIRMLERLVGCELLRRSTRHVELTLAGEALLDRARPVLAALDEAVAAAHRKADRPDAGSRSCRPPYDPSQADRGETGMRLLWWPDGESPGRPLSASR